MKIPLRLKKQLKELGMDIRNARLRRRITQALIAERAGISLATMKKIEGGSPSVAMGSYFMVLWVLGLSDSFVEIASLKNDPLGLVLENESVPKRVRK